MEDEFSAYANVSFDDFKILSLSPSVVHSFESCKAFNAHIKELWLNNIDRKYVNNSPVALVLKGDQLLSTSVDDLVDHLRINELSLLQTSGTDTFLDDVFNKIAEKQHIELKSLKLVGCCSSVKVLSVLLKHQYLFRSMYELDLSGNFSRSAQFVDCFAELVNTLSSCSRLKVFRFDSRMAAEGTVALSLRAWLASPNCTLATLSVIPGSNNGRVCNLSWMGLDIDDGNALRSGPIGEPLSVTSLDLSKNELSALDILTLLRFHPFTIGLETSEPAASERPNRLVKLMVDQCSFSDSTGGSMLMLGLVTSVGGLETLSARALLVRPNETDLHSFVDGYELGSLVRLLSALCGLGQRLLRSAVGEEAAAEDGCARQVASVVAGALRSCPWSNMVAIDEGRPLSDALDHLGVAFTSRFGVESATTVWQYMLETMPRDDFVVWQRFVQSHFGPVQRATGCSSELAAMHALIDSRTDVSVACSKADPCAAVVTIPPSLLSGTAADALRVPTWAEVRRIVMPLRDVALAENSFTRLSPLAMTLRTVDCLDVSGNAFAVGQKIQWNIFASGIVAKSCHLCVLDLSRCGLGSEHVAMLCEKLDQAWRASGGNLVSRTVASRHHHALYAGVRLPTVSDVHFYPPLRSLDLSHNPSVGRNGALFVHALLGTVHTSTESGATPPQQLPQHPLRVLKMGHCNIGPLAIAVIADQLIGGSGGISTETVDQPLQGVLPTPTYPDGGPIRDIRRGLTRFEVSRYDVDDEDRSMLCTHFKAQNEVSIACDPRRRAVWELSPLDLVVHGYKAAQCTMPCTNVIPCPPETKYAFILTLHRLATTGTAQPTSTGIRSMRQLANLIPNDILLEIFQFLYLRACKELIFSPQ